MIKKMMKVVTLLVVAALVFAGCQQLTTPASSDSSSGTTTKYTVTFNLNYDGATGAPDAQTITSGGTATKPTDPSRDSYSFNGWYAEAACTNAFDFATAITADTTLYAKWTAVDTTVKYTVAFDTNGGSSIAAVSVSSGATVTAPTDPTLASYTFGGWYTSAAKTTAYNFSDPVTADTTLYAKWVYTLQSFDGAAPALNVINYNATPIIATLSEVKAFVSNGTTNALLVTNTNYTALPKITVTLPANLSTYKYLKVRVFPLTGDSAYKPLWVQAGASVSTWSGTLGTGGCIIYTGGTGGSGNVVTGMGAWKDISIDLTNSADSSATAITALDGTTTLQLAIGISSGRCAYLIDDIRVSDGTTDTTIESFDSTAPTLGVLNNNATNRIVAQADLAAYASVTGNTSTKALLVVQGAYNNAIPYISVTLPANLSTFKALTATYLALSGDSTYKQGVLMAATSLGNTFSNTVGTDNCIAVSANALTTKPVWHTATFDLTSSAASTLITALDGTTTFQLGIGAMSGPSSIYLLDNIQLYK
jgi:uncharacterized repeat protein (TIGR02543 family)